MPHHSEVTWDKAIRTNEISWFCPHRRISEVEKSARNVREHTCPWGMLSCFQGSQHNHGTWGLTFCFHSLLWMVLGLDGDGRDAGVGNGALGLQCVLSHRSKDTVNCSQWPFDFLTFLQTLCAQNLVGLQTHHASINMTDASRVSIQGWRRKDLSHFRRRCNSHQFEKTF